MFLCPLKSSSAGPAAPLHSSTLIGWLGRSQVSEGGDEHCCPGTVCVCVCVAGCVSLGVCVCVQEDQFPS